MESSGRAVIQYVHVICVTETPRGIRSAECSRLSQKMNPLYQGYRIGWQYTFPGQRAKSMFFVCPNIYQSININQTVEYIWYRNTSHLLTQKRSAKRMIFPKLFVFLVSVYVTETHLATDSEISSVLKVLTQRLELTEVQVKDLKSQNEGNVTWKKHI